MKTPDTPTADRNPPERGDADRPVPSTGTTWNTQLVARGIEEVRTVPGEVVDTRRDVVWDVVVAPPQDRPDPANRPIIRERPLARLNALYHLPPAHPRVAMVITTPRSGPVPVGPNGRPARSAEIFWGGGTLHEVDLGLHHTSVELELPSNDELVPFTAIAEIEWRVEEPARVVKDNILDVREALVPALRHRLREITRQHRTVELTAAEDAVRTVIQVWDPGRSYGLHTSVVVRLSADKQSVKYAAQRLQLQQKTEIERLEHDLKCLVDRHDDERRKARLEVYRAIVGGGDVDRFALQLASNPDDVRTVMQLFREERDEERRQLTDFLTKLLSSGAIDRWDVEDQVRDALTWLAESTRHAVQTGEHGAQRWGHPAASNGHNGRDRGAATN